MKQIYISVEMSYLLTNSKQMALCIIPANEFAKNAGLLPCHWDNPQNITEWLKDGNLRVRMDYGTYG